ncbi:MAG: DUF4071 domain-containing protein [Sphingomonadales bacterium]|nr:DUF4071 domain-containing protein [Sphingomonadales bacterium]MBP6434027.1 DUF4071 domain-containing protein [Sphingorhabdus sp.]
MAEGAGSNVLKSLLALARAGATSRAWTAFVAAGLEASDDPEVLTLKGRLLKDQARHAQGSKRSALFARAGEAYELAATSGSYSYPLINAAAMALHAGDFDKAGRLAQKALELVDTGIDKGETPYWGEATRAEALLLSGETEAARASLSKAVALAPQAWEDQSSTLRQFASILAVTGQDGGWLDQFRPPPVMHFNGILGIAADDLIAHAAIEAAVADIAPGFAFGALAAGADIIAADAALSVGAELHVVLPSEPEDFRDSSVSPMGDEWLPRFDRIIACADSVTVCASDERTSTASVELAELHAMGMAVEKAEQLQAKAVALRIEPAQRPALGDPWLHSGRPIHHVAVTAVRDSTVAQLPAARLFYDIALDGNRQHSFGTIDEAVDAVKALGAGRAALDCRIGERIRVGTLLSHSAHGMLATSRGAALALLATGLASRIETIGEIATTVGPIEICLATFSGPPE